MPEMAKYSKAYVAGQFRQFPGWSEKTAPAQVSSADEAETGSVEYFFLHDNYVVTSGVFKDIDIAFDAITDEWREFCHNVLRFSPDGPDESEAAASD